ncbi:MAG: hypothetical protein V2J62_13190 [candidate division KSB1 bacterium]|jgi:hypothetical protein|nr:hypothetical protein [candidate division KSB1 bacterium]
MKNEALGIVVNGREVKIAHIIRDKHHMILDYLESATLKSDLEEEAKKRQQAEKMETPLISEEDDIFAIKEEPQERRSSTEKKQNAQENIDIIYSLLSKFSGRKTKVAFNVPVSNVSYQELDTHLDYNQNVFKGSLRKKIDEWRQGFNSMDNVSIISRRDGSLCNVICETQQPALLDILEQLNTFFRGNLQITLMDANEVALANLARNSYGLFNPQDITVIVDMESEFSRIIFMQGEDILLVSQLISEKYSQDVLNILYSKIIYELDNNNIQDIANIVLAGNASTENTKSFFEHKFPQTRVGYIVSQPLAENLSTQFSREELSEYAIAIGLAWKACDMKNESFIPTNLLSKQIIDSQNIFKLNLASYVLLAILGITAFGFTWQITAGKLRNNALRTQNRIYEQRIEHSDQTVKKVRALEDKITQLSEGLTLSDSLSFGSDRLLAMLEKLNQTILNTRTAWIEEVHSEKNGFKIKGLSMKRESIPDISRSLETAQIHKMVRSDFGNDQLFAFELEVDLAKERPRSFYEEYVEPHDPPMDFGDVQAKTARAENLPLKFKLQKNEDVLNSGKLTSTAPSLDQTDVETTIKKPLNPVKSMERQSDPVKIEKRVKNVNVIQRSHQSKSGSLFEIRANAHAIRLTAQKEIQNYKSKGYNATIKEMPGNGTAIPYYISLGTYTTYDDAYQDMNAIKKAVPGNYIIKPVGRK